MEFQGGACARGASQDCRCDVAQSSGEHGQEFGLQQFDDQH